MVVVERRALVVVGGGPAGLAAATAAHGAGLETCLIEQRPTLRGAMETAFETRLETVCWGIWGHELALVGPDGSGSVLIAEQVILATGSYERPVAFPGWTLPGVMSARGAARLLAQGVKPGERVVVAGYGPWIGSTAAALRDGGVNVIDVVDASAGRRVMRAEGDGTLARVCMEKTEKAVDADALVLAYGLLPENQLARLAGCQVEGSQWVQPRVVRDEWMRTSVPGVFVAGDAGGIVGEAVARAQGRRAGLAAAAANAEDAEDAPAANLDAAPPPEVYRLADAETVICRCEDVTAGQIAERIFSGSLEPGPVIAESRAGMGHCQGRACAGMIAAVIAQHTGEPIERIPAITARPPVLPVPVGALAERPPTFEAD